MLFPGRVHSGAARIEDAEARAMKAIMQPPPGAGMPARPEEAAPRHPGRFAALDGWRGVCASMVVLFHVPVVSGWGSVEIVRHAFLFVDFFFVLSGFVIAHAYAGRLSTGLELQRFVAARFIRVYPLHLAMLLAFLVFEGATAAAHPEAAFAGGNSVRAFFANLFLLHAFGTVDGLGWNYPSWSISAECGAYLVFGLAALWLGRRSPLALAALVVVAVPAIALKVGELDTSVAFGWLRCLLGFSCGALLRLRLWRPAEAGGRAPSLPAWTLAEGATLAAVAVFVAVAGHRLLSLAAPFVFTAAVFVFAHEAGAVSRLMRRRVFAFLGLISYSIYMTHAFVISRAINLATVLESRFGLSLTVLDADGSKSFGPEAWKGDAALVAVLLLTVAASAVTWALIERPGQRLAARPAAGTARRPATASAVFSEPAS